MKGKLCYWKSQSVQTYEKNWANVQNTEKDTLFMEADRNIRLFSQIGEIQCKLPLCK